jgi:hypothetical protein
LIRPALLIFGLIAALVLAGGQSAGASELLANGGFEGGAAGWSTNAGQLDAVGSPLHGGSLAARFSGSGQPSTQFAYQLINVQPAQAYELSGWVAASGDNVNNVFLRIAWFDANGDPVPLVDDSGGLPLRDGTFYTLTTGQRTSPAAARSARVSAYVLGNPNSPFTVHLDDFTFAGPAAIPPPPPTPAPAVTPTPTATAVPPGQTPGPRPTRTRTPGPGSPPRGTAAPPGAAEPDAFPELVNGGFEQLRADGTPYGWHKQGGEMSTVTDRVTEGVRALAFSSETSSTKWAYQTVVVKPGGYYAASAEALAGPGAESVFLRLSWYASADGSGAAIGSIDSLESASPNDGGFRGVTTGPVQAPDGANSVKLRLMLRPSSGEPASVYFDEAGFGPTQPAPGETVRVAGALLAPGGEELALAEAGGPGGLAPGAATPVSLANVKPSRPGEADPPASTAGGADDWPIFLAIGMAVAVIALAGGYDLWQRKYGHEGRADEP